MPNPHLRAFARGQSLTAAHVNELSRIAGMVGNVNGPGGKLLAGGLNLVEPPFPFFLARITGSAPATPTPKLAWQQIGLRPDGTYYLPEPALAGSLTKNWAHSVLRTTHEDGTVGLMRLGTREDVYEFYPLSAGGGDGPTPEPGFVPCADCGWLLDVPTDRVLRLTLPRKAGRCQCIDLTQGDDPEGLRFILVHDGTSWKGWRMFETCCSCATVELRIVVTADNTLDDIPEFDLIVKSSCADEEEVTYRLRLECCPEPGIAIFSAGGADLCGAAFEASCDNTFQVALECGPCDLPNVLCDACFSGIGPPFYFVHVEGFSGVDAVYNGDWYLQQEDCGCVWFVECGGIRLEITVVRDTETTSHAELVLSGGDNTHTFAYDPNTDPEIPLLVQCFSTLPFEREAGEVTALNGVPKFCNNLPGCCQPSDVPSSVTFVMPCIGVNVTLALGGTPTEIFFGYGYTTVTPTWCNDGFTVDVPPAGPGPEDILVPNSFSVNVACNVVHGVRVFAMSITTGDGGHAGASAVLNGACDPFYILFDASYGVCGDEPPGSCVAAVYEADVTPSWCVDGVCVAQTTPPEGGIGPFFGDCEEVCNCSTPEAMALMADARSTGGIVTHRNGPGTELKNLLAELGLPNSKECACKSRESKMNRWRLEGCLANRGEIEDWLRKEAKKVGWRHKIKAAALAVASGLAARINPFDVAPGLFDIALERWRKRLDEFRSDAT